MSRARTAVRRGAMTVVAMILVAAATPAYAYEVTTRTGFQDARSVATSPIGSGAVVAQVTQNSSDANFYLAALSGLPCAGPVPWSIRSGLDAANNVAFSPDGTLIWIALPDSVRAVSATTCLTVGSPVTIPASDITLKGIAVTADGTRVLVANPGSDSISVINAVTRSLVRTVTLATPFYDEPFALAASPTDGTVYFTAASGDHIGSLSSADDYLSVTSVAASHTFSTPQGVAFSPDGRRAYVTNSNPVGGQWTVTVIDTATGGAVADVGSGGVMPYGVAVSPDGRFAYVTNYFGPSMTIIATATNTVAATVSFAGPGISRASAVAVSASGTTAWIPSDGTDTVFEVRLGPGAPTEVAATPGQTTASVAFTAGTHNGASITDYEYSLDGGAWTSAGSAVSPITVRGLTAGTTYSLRLRALNGQAPGDPSNAITVTTSSPSSEAPASRTPSSEVPALKTSAPTIRVQRQRVVITSNVTAPRAGTIVQTGTRLAGRSGTTLCRTTRKAPKAGRYAITCTLGRSVRAVLRTSSLRLRLTTIFTGGSTTATSTRDVVVPRRG